MSDPHHVLVVAPAREDVTDALTALERTGGLTVATSERPADALSRLAAETPACLLLAPPFPGIETDVFLEVVRATYPTLPIVVLAGNPPDVGLQDALAAGATEVIDESLETISAATLKSRLTTAITRQHDASTLLPPEHRRAPADSLPNANMGSQLLALLRENMRAVVTASTRSDLEQDVCERLRDTGLYTGVWYGEYDPATEELTPKAQTGLAEAALEDLRLAIDKPGTELDPYEQVIRTAVVTVVPTLAAASATPWREVGREQDATALAVVPVASAGRSFGVLSLYAARPDAFGVREQAVLADLGDLLGYAYLSLERQTTLLADTSIELEFAVRDEACPFAALTATTPATCTLDAVVAPPDGPVMVYVTVTGAAPAQVRDHAAAIPVIAAVRLVREYDDSHQWEVSLAATAPSMLTTLAEHGATVRSLEAAAGEATVLAEVAATADVSAIVDALQAVVPESEVVAKRTHDRPVRTVRGLQADLTERLTDKQRAALREAYAAGYFERPRLTTGSELAAVMGVSSSTYHQHLDVALAKLVELLLESPGERDTRPVRQPRE